MRLLFSRLALGSKVVMSTYAPHWNVQCVLYSVLTYLRHYICRLTVLILRIRLRFRLRLGFGIRIGLSLRLGIRLWLRLRLRLRIRYVDCRC